MKDIIVDVGVYTAYNIKLTAANFVGVKQIILTIKNSPTPGSPAIIEKIFTEPKEDTLLITPEQSLQLTSGAVYDFNKVSSDDKRYKITENGRIILRYGVGDCV